MPRRRAVLLRRAPSSAGAARRQPPAICPALKRVVIKMSDLFSGIQAAMVINRVENCDKSVEDWDSDGDGSGCSTGVAGTPCFTSRLSVLKAASVIAQFSEFKR